MEEKETIRCEGCNKVLQEGEGRPFKLLIEVGGETQTLDEYGHICESARCLLIGICFRSRNFSE